MKKKKKKRELEYPFPNVMYVKYSFINLYAQPNRCPVNLCPFCLVYIFQRFYTAFFRSDLGWGGDSWGLRFVFSHFTVCYCKCMQSNY